ncbi:MAG TPA: DUF5317 family protein [Candidatus Limnocylindrales bacterium]|nr:DUF5317 family protein [Candidatus Limnocylindrales bacterium]
MFMLWAIPAGLVLGTLRGGTIEGLTHVLFRWAPLAVAALLVQVVLFTPLGDQLTGGFAPAIYVISTAAVFAAVLRNLQLTGMPIVGLGALCNLVAIAANGGAMPANAAALAAAGLDGPGAHTNSVVLAAPALRPLTDIYAVPAWVPLANVFSVGDVLIGVGIVVVIVIAMRRGNSAAAATATKSAAL